MSRKAVECENCGTEYTVVYDADDSTDDPIHCPFCGEVARQEDADDIDGGYGDDWEL